MRHAVSSASKGSREENVRGAKLTEKRTRGAPCSFKCKQGLQGRKRQGRQIDGEKDERGAMQFQVHNYDVSFFYVSNVYHCASAVPSLKL